MLTHKFAKCLKKWRENRNGNVKKMKAELTEALTEMELSELADKVRNYWSRTM